MPNAEVSTAPRQGSPFAPGPPRRPPARAGLSVVVPVYNSEGSLPALIERLADVLPTLARDFEVVLVNDGSRDRSWQVVCALAEAHPWIRAFRLLRNFGQHNALLCGVRAARFDVIVTIDDDLQHPPEEIGALLAALDDGHDVVYGTPVAQQHGLLRNLASSATKMALRGAMGVETAGSVSAFRAFRTPLRAAFADYRNASVSLDVLLTWATTRFTVVRVRHEARHSGVSNYTVARLAQHALNMVTGFSTLPLRIASFVGFAFTLFGLVVLLFVIGRYVASGGSIPGFPFLASIIAIFSGAQLFALGIMGEYLARMHLRTQDRPVYVVAEELRARADAPADG